MTLRINSTHSHAERGDDCYFTPPEATRALLAIERIPLSVCDPACGNWAILDVLTAAGHICHGSDIRDFGHPYTVIRNYLTERLSLEEDRTTRRGTAMSPHLLIGLSAILAIVLYAHSRIPKHKSARARRRGHIGTAIITIIFGMSWAAVAPQWYANS